MVSMPTGSGKSLLFQIAASFERETTPGACAIVITPTVALALDHERTLSGLKRIGGEPCADRRHAADRRRRRS